jgi:hypothetical protein
VHTVFSLKTKITISKSHDNAIFLKIQSNHSFHLFLSSFQLYFQENMLNLLKNNIFCVNLTTIEIDFRNFTCFQEFHEILEISHQ